MSTAPEHQCVTVDLYDPEVGKRFWRSYAAEIDALYAFRLIISVLDSPKTPRSEMLSGDLMVGLQMGSKGLEILHGNDAHKAEFAAFLRDPGVKAELKAVVAENGEREQNAHMIGTALGDIVVYMLLNSEDAWNISITKAPFSVTDGDREIATLPVDPKMCRESGTGFERVQRFASVARQDGRGPGELTAVKMYLYERVQKIWNEILLEMEEVQKAENRRRNQKKNTNKNANRKANKKAGKEAAAVATGAVKLEALSTIPDTPEEDVNVAAADADTATATALTPTEPDQPDPDVLVSSMSELEVSVKNRRAATEHNVKKPAPAARTVIATVASEDYDAPLPPSIADRQPSKYNLKTSIQDDAQAILDRQAKKAAAKAAKKRGGETGGE